MKTLLSSLSRIREDKPTKKILVYLCLIFLSVLVSSLHYCFSPLSNLAGHPDPGCFYMVGKAWAHGMIPYVDAIDIKGPLLFAFFAIGYLIHGTFGVYILLTLCLICTILGIYRITQLHSPCNAISFLSISFFLSIYLNLFPSDGRAEDIMLPMLVWAIYACLHCMTYPRDPRHMLFAGRVLGVSAGVITLIKYNGVIPLAFIGLWLLLFCIRMRYGWKLIAQYITLGLFYCLLVFVIVAICLHTQKALFPCLEVYFDIFRAAKMANINIFYDNNIIICGAIISCIIITATLMSLLEKNRDSRWISFFWMAYAIGIMLACMKGWKYYYIIGVPIIIYPCMIISSFFKRGNRFKTTGILMATGMFFCLSLRTDIKRVYNQYIISNVTYTDVVDDEISKVQNARILYLGTLDLGLGSLSDALPACRYWMTLNGDVFHAIPEQLRCVEQRIPDFVITYKNSNDMNKAVAKFGYDRCIEGKIESYYVIFWKKKKL